MEELTARRCSGTDRSGAGDETVPDLTRSDLSQPNMGQITETNKCGS